MYPFNSQNNGTKPILQIKLKLREFQKLVHWQNLIRTQKNIYITKGCLSLESKLLLYFSYHKIYIKKTYTSFPLPSIQVQFSWLSRLRNVPVSRIGTFVQSSAKRECVSLFKMY